MDNFNKINDVDNTQTQNGKQKAKLPVIFLILRIVAICALIIGAIVLIKGLSMHTPNMGSSNWFNESSRRMNFISGGGACLGFGCFLLFISFLPAIAKLQVKTAKYIQEQNQQDLSDMGETSADILQGGLTKATKTIQKTLLENENTSNSKNLSQTKSNTDIVKFCPYCGADVKDGTSFCHNCGKKLY